MKNLVVGGGGHRRQFTYADSTVAHIHYCYIVISIPVTKTKHAIPGISQRLQFNVTWVSRTSNSLKITFDPCVTSCR